MPVPCNITFPGIAQPIHAVVTNTIGARPDTAVIYSQLQDASPDTSGLSTFVYGFNGVNVTWVNCLCDRGTKVVSDHGHMQVYQIQDRRWLWRKNFITRAYNVRQPDNSVDAETQATVAQIVTDLFTAMGETVDVSAITTEEEPEIVYDRDNCVNALEELLYPRGYIIAPNMSSTTTTIYVRGFGASLPANTDVVSVTMSTDPPEGPNILAAYCGRTLVQSKLLCQAVGLDTDGSWQLVNSLSYMPTGGWAGTDLYTMNMIADPVAKQRALETVGKCYQVVSQGDGTFNLNAGGVDYCPGQIVVNTAWQYLPLEPVLLTAAVDPFGKIRFDAPYIEGTFVQTEEDQNPAQQVNSAAFSRIRKRDWKLDRELGIVEFADVALQKTNIGQLTFATVYLTCAYSVHDLDTFVKDRYYATVTPGGLGTEILKRDELNRQLIVNYTPSTATATSITDNSSALDTELDNLLNAALFSYQTQNGLVAIYRGIYAFALDGVNLQIRWELAASGPLPFGTYVSQFYEGIPQLPTVQERATIRRAAMADDPTNRRTRNYKQAMQTLRLKGP